MFLTLIYPPLCFYYYYYVLFPLYAIFLSLIIIIIFFHFCIIRVCLWVILENVFNIFNT